MGFLDRFRRQIDTGSPTERAGTVQGSVLLGGRDTLEVVGESFYQPTIWQFVGGDDGSPVRCPTQAVLVHEPTNPYDANAIQVLIGGGLVGHLSREDASAYLPGLLALVEAHGCAVALSGHVVGGAWHGDRRGMLGVFLDHEPADFGIGRRQAATIGELRTGLSQAIATDLEDDSYDLSWLDQLSGTQSASDIVKLRRLLVEERDPIDRHYMLCELERCLYKNREAFPSALDEFDAVCEQHHAEMVTLRPVLVSKFLCVPLIDMYRQASIRSQKARDWPAVVKWSERGLEVYGEEAARTEAVEDLRKRLAHATAKMLPPPSRKASPRPSATTSEFVVETLICQVCGSSFQRERTRGRKPHNCPPCRGETSL